jgi:hypothetical protein
LLGQQTQRGAAKVGHALGEAYTAANDEVNGSIVAPVTHAFDYIFKTPAQSKPKVQASPGASIVPHKSPSAGESTLAQHIVNPQRQPTPTTTTSTATAGKGTAAAPGTLPAPTPLNTSNIDTVLNAGAGPNQEQASINTLLQFAVNPAVANEAMAWFTQESNNQVPSTEMQSAMYQQGWFKTMFPGIAQQIAKGVPDVVSPAQYMSDYESIQQNLQNYGVDASVLSPALYGNLVGQNLSATQINGRLALAFNQAGADLENNPGAIADLSKWYGVAPTKAGLAAFYMTGNPADGAPNVAGNLGNITAAAVGGAAAQSQGFSKLSQSDLISMANQGVTASNLESASAQQASDLSATEKGVASANMPTVTETELLQAGPGVPGTTVDGVNAQEAQRQTNLAVGGRVSAFKGGGGFAGSGQPGQPTGAGYGEQ